MKWRDGRVDATCSRLVARLKIFLNLLAEPYIEIIVPERIIGSLQRPPYSSKIRTGITGIPYPAPAPACTERLHHSRCSGSSC